MKKTLLLITLLATANTFIIHNSNDSHNNLIPTNNKTNVKGRATTTNLNDLILNKNLFTIKTGGFIKPTTAQILATAKKLNTNPKINWSKISVAEDSITSTSATLISLDTSVYSGQVNVTYNLDISARLSDVITTTNLKLIKIDGWKNKTDFKNILIAKLKELNSKYLDWSKISIDENSITWEGAEVISTDTTVYSGVVDINFNTSVVRNANISYKYSYNGTSSQGEYTTPTITIFGFWTEFASDWTSFTKIFPSLSFDSDSFISVQTTDGTSTNKNLSISTSNINTTISSKFSCSRNDRKVFRIAQISLGINIWHDDHNIYANTQIDELGQLSTEGLFATANLTNVNFPIVNN